MKLRVVSLTLLTLAVGCGSHHHPGPWVVTKQGRIGSLQLDRSDRAAVIAAAGQPDAERSGGEPGGFARFDELGYDCAKGHKPGPLPDAGEPYCRTLFFINAKTGRLGTFFTTSPRYVEQHGVRIDMSQAAAERLLRKRLTVGCETNIYLYGRAATLTIAFEGGVSPKRSTSVKGAHVYAFALHSPKHDAGVSDCL